MATKSTTALPAIFTAALGITLCAGIASHAQTACLSFPSNSTPPAGYAASWDVFSPGKELLIKTNCPSSGTTLTLRVGKGDSTQLVYNTAYVYNGSWSAQTLSGTVASGAWLSGEGTKQITAPSTASASSPLYLVGYVCTNRSSAWKCGCENASCSAGKWQLQGYTGPSGGGATTSGPRCGNFVCESGESASCPADCGGGGGGAGAHNYFFRPPADIDLSDGNVIVHYIDGGADHNDGRDMQPYFPNPNDWNKIILVVPPNRPLEGTIGVSGSAALKARGVFIIGPSWRRTEGCSSIHSPAEDYKNDLGGCNAAINIMFAQGAPKRPFLWVSNADFDTTGTYWGDFIRTGTHDNAAVNNYDDWMDTYLQKIKVRNGHYFWSGATAKDGEAAGLLPHSDFWQPVNPWRAVYLANADIRWFGQTIFARFVGDNPASSCSGYIGHPDARIEMYKVMFRPMPYNPLVYDRIAYDNRRALYLSACMDSGSPGTYISNWFKEVYAEKKPAAVAGENQSMAEYFSVHGSSRRSESGTRLNFSAASANGRPPVVDTSNGGESFITFSEPPSPVVRDDEVGWGAAIDSAAELRQIFGR